jgi:glycogen debranching enzyme
VTTAKWATAVWPHANSLVGLGLALSGQRWAPPRILTAMHDVAAGMRDHRLPELFCGMPRGRAAGPVQYPVSCVPQAWAAGALFMLLQATTGFLPDAPRRAVSTCASPASRPSSAG